MIASNSPPLLDLAGTILWNVSVRIDGAGNGDENDYDLGVRVPREVNIISGSTY